jgi:hypothetical protein
VVRLHVVSVALPRDIVNSFSLSPPCTCVRMLLPSGSILIQSVMILVLCPRSHDAMPHGKGMSTVANSSGHCIVYREHWSVVASVAVAEALEGAEDGGGKRMTWQKEQSHGGEDPVLQYIFWPLLLGSPDGESPSSLVNFLIS